MIIVTGGAGFIGSAVVWGLNTRGRRDILIVDRLAARGQSEKWKNLVDLRYHDFIPADRFPEELARGKWKSARIEACIHMGACSSTTETNADYLMQNNYAYTRALAEYCVRHNIRFIYASSAATYGNGEQGWGDDDAATERLRPLNIYGYSKHAFDLSALRQGWDKRMVGLKFFNVFGPNEYHKGEMRSVVHKAYQALLAGQEFRLFRSHRPDIADGEQKRDFLWVKDAVKVILFFLENKNLCGIYNVGSGKASGFNDLLRAVMRAMNISGGIQYADMPPDLRERYQYFTEADITKLRRAGYAEPFTPLDEAIREYILEYLSKYPWLCPR
ncbi:MAG: ADP-glyceromanno-heptose 6-epimerase [Spirochaetota bacterium]|jgi:ADP-L-glycero-D-manno-heptose 6-epimerase|nr:ADP-glyceromanno-heptose 6-epimerase [Spirochaetota bacterium]